MMDRKGFLFSTFVAPLLAMFGKREDPDAWRRVEPGFTEGWTRLEDAGDFGTMWDAEYSSAGIGVEGLTESSQYVYAVSTRHETKCEDGVVHHREHWRTWDGECEWWGPWYPANLQIPGR